MSECATCGAAIDVEKTPGLCPACLILGVLQPLGTVTNAETTFITPADLDDDQFGPYYPVRRIGEGGMGVVYLAEQTHPVRRQVALKVVKLGMDTKQVIARFETERQTLALMDHPAIARVYDAGTSRRGRPYFVMEFVDGIPITDYCDEHRLRIKERLELFIQVCVAVQ